MRILSNRDNKKTRIVLIVERIRVSALSRGEPTGKEELRLLASKLTLRRKNSPLPTWVVRRRGLRRLLNSHPISSLPSSLAYPQRLCALHRDVKHLNCYPGLSPATGSPRLLAFLLPSAKPDRRPNNYSGVGCAG
jgi:hypothetical protein